MPNAITDEQVDLAIRAQYDYEPQPWMVSAQRSSMRAALEAYEQANFTLSHEGAVQMLVTESAADTRMHLANYFGIEDEEIEAERARQEAGE